MHQQIGSGGRLRNEIGVQGDQLTEYAFAELGPGTSNREIQVICYGLINSGLGRSLQHVCHRQQNKKGEIMVVGFPVCLVTISSLKIQL